MKLTVGDKAPLFRLQDQNGQEQSLAKYTGNWVLVYFYPKDDTPGCTKEACGIRDNFQTFQKADVVVLGISGDTVKSHKKFEQKYGLPFTLLADPDKVVVTQYGVWGKKKFFGRAYMGVLRTSFLINPAGKIAKIYEKVKPEHHAQEIIRDLKELSQ